VNNETIFLDQNYIDVYVEIPDFFGTLSSYKIIWISQIVDNYYEVSVKGQHGGYHIWLMRLDGDGTYTPLSRTECLSMTEVTKYNLAQKLNMKISKMMDIIIKARVEADRSKLCQNLST